MTHKSICRESMTNASICRKSKTQKSICRKSMTHKEYMQEIYDTQEYMPTSNLNIHQNEMKMAALKAFLGQNREELIVNSIKNAKEVCDDLDRDQMSS